MKVRWPLFVRRLHKWLALIVGIQVVIWTLTGFYMVVIHIDRIHGDHLVQVPVTRVFEPAAMVNPQAVLRDFPHATAIASAQLLGRPVWRVESAQGARLVDARTGDILAPVREGQVRAIAKKLYTSNDPIRSVEMIAVAPMEMQGREPPYWQVVFDRWDSPTFYISPETGELISRRHSLWRIFDFAWMLHIMDYDDRTDVNNPLLRIGTWMAASMAISGAWLLFWAFPRRKRKKRKT